MFATSAANSLRVVGGTGLRKIRSTGVFKSKPVGNGRQRRVQTSHEGVFKVAGEHAGKYQELPHRSCVLHGCCNGHDRGYRQLYCAAG